MRARTEREPHLIKQARVRALRADRHGGGPLFPVLETLEDELEHVKITFSLAPGARGHRCALRAQAELMTLKHAAGPLGGDREQAARRTLCRGLRATQEYFRDVYDHLVRINQSIDACATW